MENISCVFFFHLIQFVNTQTWMKFTKFKLAKSFHVNLIQDLAKGVNMFMVCLQFPIQTILVIVAGYHNKTGINQYEFTKKYNTLSFSSDKFILHSQFHLVVNKVLEKLYKIMVLLFLSAGNVTLKSFKQLISSLSTKSNSVSNFFHFSRTSSSLKGNLTFQSHFTFCIQFLPISVGDLTFFSSTNINR